MVYIKYLK